ncbi:Serine/threonine protein kinase [Lentzea albidocapillata subsp. violacea]|uniref:non-specific serine/threonine protein kinase n=1 Tax=Lentzea albidocapillata subsp. violacea TaxID=128104 RepID=A0A1G8XND8_9PSEU|nr:serine/threonine-protein kinase [Lentzea albidocapillata]SDJ91405.1 Serine/threonine protein kinase [Lentzea albidocapillata subsp. violacea]
MIEQGDLIAGRYRLQRQIGSGGMGVVWQAFDERLDRVVALKHLVLQPGLSTEEAERSRQRAVREARIAASLQHPGAVTVHDVTEDDDGPVLVMEYVPARSLAELIAARGPLPASQAARIGGQVAAALAAAHEAGIVHRDIKPANILITDTGTAKITDFGIARVHGDTTVTATGLLVGTPAFLAPEVAQGHEPNRTSDVFSLGATLYTAVEGRAPFGDGDNAIALLHAVAAGQMIPPAHHGPITDVVLHMMRTDPAARPTMAQAAESLHAAATGRPAPAPTRVDLQPVAGPSAAASRRLRTALPIAAAAVAAVVLIALLYPQLTSSDRAVNQPPAPTTSTVAAAQLQQAVADYYALLPDRTDEAWTRLSPAMQAQGREQYEKAWKDVKDLVVTSAPQATNTDTVTIGLEYVIESRGRLRETRQLRLITGGGRVLIDSEQVLTSERVNGKSEDGDKKDRDGEKDDKKRGEERKGGN